MEHRPLVEAIETHSTALRTAAVASGPEALVPTCPPWTVHRLISHIGRVHSWVREAIRDPSGSHVRPERAPEQWADTLAWWDDIRTRLLEALSATPDTPAWLPFSGYPPTIASWARRQAHEAAIHRLDAEHALGTPEIEFAPDFAADGIDELLAAMLPSKGATTFAASGIVLVHAADVGKLWTIRVRPDEPCRASADTELAGAFEADMTIAGTADAVYRAIWRRPSGAVVSGDTTLAEPISPP